MALKRVAGVLALAFMLTAVGLTGVGCHNALDDYDDFLSRRGDGGVDAMMVESSLQNLSGMWQLHALLAGGLDLGLRVQLTMDLTAQPIPLHAKLWLVAADPTTDPPLLETDSTVNADGTFVLNAEPLQLAAGSTPGLNIAVTASVVLSASTQSATAFCGMATGSVEEPLSINLAGSTFAALPDRPGLTISQVPQSCFPRNAVDAGVVTTPEPSPPDLSAVPSSLADLSGSWLVTANLAGAIPLQLWAELTFTESPADGGIPVGGSLDGALRRMTDPPGSVALTTFSTGVDANGRFSIWLPELIAGQTQASVLLVGATRSVSLFCGAGAGRVHRPLDLDLAGTTFAAIRWAPGEPSPSPAPAMCQ